MALAIASALAKTVTSSSFENQRSLTGVPRYPTLSISICPAKLLSKWVITVSLLLPTCRQGDLCRPTGCALRPSLLRTSPCRPGHHGSSNDRGTPPDDETGT